MALSEEARAIEAVLIVPGEPAPPGLLAELLEIPVDRVEPLCEELIESCREDNRGFAVVRIAGGYRIQTHPDLAPYVERFANVGVSSRLSAAALETLAIVAYKQPVSRAQISALRGVNVDGVVRLLEHRGYIAAVGRAAGPGQAALYATTDAFLERLGLDRLEQLPPVEDLLPGPEALAGVEGEFRPDADGWRNAGAAPAHRGPTAEGDGPHRRRLAPGVRGTHRRRPGYGQRGGARPRSPGRS